MGVLYFAYGSNLHLARMRARAPSAVTVGVGELMGWRLACNKLGRDGSGKANLIPSPGGRVWGAVYRLSGDDLLRLDGIECGYRRRTLAVSINGQTPAAVQTYVATLHTDRPLPLVWYRDLMVTGARQHGLPDDYVAALAALPHL